jgi:hypothetical protein
MTESCSDQSIQSAAAESRRNAWAIMLAGLMLGMVGMHLTAVRPLKQQINMLQQDLIGVQGDLQRMTGMVRLAEQANGVRDTLTAQRRQIEEARVAAESIRRLCTNIANIKSTIEQDAYNTDLAIIRVDELLNIKDQIIWRGANTAAARKTVDELLMLRDGLTAESVDVAAAGQNLEMLLNMHTKLTQRNIDNDRFIETRGRFSIDRLRDNQPIPGAFELATIALRTSAVGRAYQQFEPLMKLAGIGPINERRLEILADKMLAKQPTRISSLDRSDASFGPRDHASRLIPPSLGRSTSIAPVPLDEQD